MSKIFLFISPQYLPTTGGVERYTNYLARHLVQRGHRVIIATSELIGLPATEIDADGIEVFRFPSWPLMSGRLPIVRPCSRFLRMAHQLWAIPIDHCIINTYFYPLSIYAASQCKKRNIPAIIINHGTAWLMTGNIILELAGKIYEQCTARLCHHYCKRFYGVSLAAAEWMSHFSISADGIITNAIDPDYVMSAQNASIDWRSKLGLPKSAKIIAFVGRMIPEKGVDQLINAMEDIRKAHPDAHLLMAGPGPLFEKHHHSSPIGVHLLGSQPYSDVLALLKQANIFCLPSRSEGFACTVLESAALGCPIITTATGGSPQLLINRNYGILLESMNSDVISCACKEALDDPSWCETAARLSERRLRENFTWECAVDQLLDAIAHS